MISFDTSGDGPSSNGKDRSKGGGAGANFQHKYGPGSHGATGDTIASCSTQQLSTVVTPLTQCRCVCAMWCGVAAAHKRRVVPAGTCRMSYGVVGAAQKAYAGAGRGRWPGQRALGCTREPLGSSVYASPRPSNKTLLARCISAGAWQRAPRVMQNLLKPGCYGSPPSLFPRPAQCNGSTAAL